MSTKKFFSFVVRPLPPSPLLVVGPLKKILFLELPLQMKPDKPHRACHCLDLCVTDLDYDYDH